MSQDSHPQPSQPQAYQSQPYGQPAQASGLPVPPTNTLAVLALIFAFVCWPLGIIFGHLARRQIARTGENGRGFAVAGLVIGYAMFAIVVLVIVAVAVLAATAPSPPPPTW